MSLTFFQVFAVTKLDTVFNIRNDQADALSSI
jgi:uncharacterized membrane protein